MCLCQTDILLLHWQTKQKTHLAECRGVSYWLVFIYKKMLPTIEDVLEEEEGFAFFLTFFQGKNGILSFQKI